MLKHIVMMILLFAINLRGMEKNLETKLVDYSKLQLSQIVQMPLNELSLLKLLTLRKIIRTERCLDKEDTGEELVESTLQKRIEELKANCKRPSSMSKNAYRKANKERLEESKKSIKVMEDMVQMIAAERERRKAVHGENERLCNTPYGFRLSAAFCGGSSLDPEGEFKMWLHQLEQKERHRSVKYTTIIEGICTVIAQRGYYVNWSSKTQNSWMSTYPLLWYAVKHHDLNFVTFLCDRGADINWKDQEGNSLLWSLFKSTNAKSVELTKYFLENGADLEIDKHGNTLLHRLLKEQYETDYCGDAEEIRGCIMKKAVLLLNTDIDLEAKNLLDQSVKYILRQKTNHFSWCWETVGDGDAWCWRCKAVIWFKDFQEKFTAERERRKKSIKQS